MLFNLIPIPPLDGEEVLAFLLPAKAAMTYEKLRPYGSFILLGFILIGQFSGFNIINQILQPIMTGIAKFLLGV